MPPKRRRKPRSPELAALGAAVEQLRLETGLTQETVADEAHMTFTRVGHLERGLSNVTFETLLRISQSLEIPLIEIIERYERELAKRTSSGSGQ